MVTLVFTLLTMIVLGLVSAVAVGRIGGGLDAPVSSLPSRGLPEGDLTNADLEAIRFAPALRGYRMDEVDAVVDRLAEELRRREAEVEQLRQQAARAQPYSQYDAGQYDAGQYDAGQYDAGQYERSDFETMAYGQEGGFASGVQREET